MRKELEGFLEEVIFKLSPVRRNYLCRDFSEGGSQVERTICRVGDKLAISLEQGCNWSTVSRGEMVWDEVGTVV